MPKAFHHSLIAFLLMFAVPSYLHAQQPNDIVGSWISSQRNVIVQIFDSAGSFRGRVIWFDDTDDATRPMHSRMDIHNPSEQLRTRKVLGLEVLTDLNFNEKCHCWQNGKIYDTQSGKTWDATVFQENINRLRVRGFWHFQFLGKSLIFQRFTGTVNTDSGS